MDSPSSRPNPSASSHSTAGSSSLSLFTEVRDRSEGVPPSPQVQNCNQDHPVSLDEQYGYPPKSSVGASINARSYHSNSQVFSEKIDMEGCNEICRTKHTQSADVQHPMIGFDSSNGPDRRILQRGAATEKEEDERLATLSGAVRTILECVGEDPNREGLLDTPARYAKAMLFLTKGYDESLPTIVKCALFQEDYDEMVIVRDIEFSSLCEHHILPFSGRMCIGYIPNRLVIGLSKIARIVAMFSQRLQIQERLTKQVGLALDEVLQPQGVAVVVEAQHSCMAMRGVQKIRTSTTTTCMLGRLQSTAETRKEFLDLISRK